MTERPPGTVEIREVEQADLPIFFLHQQDSRASEMAGYPSRSHKAFMRHWMRMLNDGESIARTILHDGEVAGHAVVTVYSGRHEISYWLGREFWGQGITTNGLATFLDQVKTRPIHAHVMKHNVASIRVLEKCGFELVREQRNLRLMMLPESHGGPPLQYNTS